MSEHIKDHKKFITISHIVHAWSFVLFIGFCFFDWRISLIIFFITSSVFDQLSTIAFFLDDSKIFHEIEINIFLKKSKSLKEIIIIYIISTLCYLIIFTIIFWFDNMTGILSFCIFCGTRYFAALNNYQIINTIIYKE